MLRADRGDDMTVNRNAFARALLAGAAMLAACMPAHAASVLDAIHSRGTLRVGTTGDYKPFSFRAADGSYSGADIIMAGRLAEKLGVKLVLVPTSWGSIMDDFVAGKFDIAVGGVTILPPRAEKGLFTAPNYVDGKRPVARCTDRDRFTSIAAINQPDVRVVVNPGASNEAFARSSFPQAKLTVHADNPTVPEEIVAGRADVFVTDGIEVAHIAHVHPELCPTNVPALFTKLEKAYWLQNDPDLLKITDAWLDGEMQSGFWQKTLDAALAAP
jgi:cyclohexadienyl dehydratase